LFYRQHRQVQPISFTRLLGAEHSEKKKDLEDHEQLRSVSWRSIGVTNRSVKLPRHHGTKTDLQRAKVGVLDGFRERVKFVRRDRQQLGSN
jgi:hypothetical protein